MNIWLKNTILLALMLMASSFAMGLRPQPQHLDAGIRINLGQIVPIVFGEWREEPSSVITVVNPELQDALGKTYSETLSRTYVNNSGDRVMLSLAYGANQTREFQIHKPEVCYAAQGFQLANTQLADLLLDGHNVPVMQIVAKSGARNEPITYWIRSGDYRVRGWYEQNKARLIHGFRGVIPDGLLIRVSSISDDGDTAFKTHEKFLDEMLRSLSDQDLLLFLGKGKI